MIAIIDYDAGNLKSVEKALHCLGAQTVVTRDPETILSSEKAILPGVGAFGDAMSHLKQFGLVEVIHSFADSGRPFLGICLGLQLLFEFSEESPEEAGLGLLPGKIMKIPDVPDTNRNEMQREPLKIPHMGWNSLNIMPGKKLFQGIEQGAYVYFVHSYYLQASDPSLVAATTEYGTCIHASVEKDHIFACQFHPEKSSETGLKILKNFADL